MSDPRIQVTWTIDTRPFEKAMRRANRRVRWMLFRRSVVDVLRTLLRRNPCK